MQNKFLTLLCDKCIAEPFRTLISSITAQRCAEDSLAKPTGVRTTVEAGNGHEIMCLGRTEQNSFQFDTLGM